METTQQNKLKQLRIEWIKHPEKRNIIEIQAKILKWKAKEEVKELDNLEKDVINNLL